MMPLSKVVVPKKAKTTETTRSRERLRKSYLLSRELIDDIEIELNRSQVVMIDEDGK
ncbi:hypothetical protein P4S72_12590 [Vibrio sp. PP-XX7]